MVSGSRRWAWCPPYSNDLDYQSFFDGLAARVVCVEGRPDGLFGTQGTLQGDIFIVLFATDNFQCNVRSIDAAAKRIGIFLQDHIANIVNQVVLGDFDSGRGSTWAFHPDLSLHSLAATISEAWS